MQAKVFVHLYRLAEAVLNGDLGGPCPPIFGWPPSFVLNVTFNFV